MNKEISEEVKALIFRNLYEDPKEIAKKLNSQTEEERFVAGWRYSGVLGGEVTFLDDRVEGKRLLLLPGTNDVMDILGGWPTGGSLQWSFEVEAATLKMGREAEEKGYKVITFSHSLGTTYAQRLYVKKGYFGYMKNGTPISADYLLANNNQYAQNLLDAHQGLKIGEDQPQLISDSVDQDILSMGISYPLATRTKFELSDARLETLKRQKIGKSREGLQNPRENLQKNQFGSLFTALKSHSAETGLGIFMTDPPQISDYKSLIERDSLKNRDFLSLGENFSKIISAVSLQIGDGKTYTTELYQQDAPKTTTQLHTNSMEASPQQIQVAQYIPDLSIAGNYFQVSSDGSAKSVTPKKVEVYWDNGIVKDFAGNIYQIDDKNYELIFLQGTD